MYVQRLQISQTHFIMGILRILKSLYIQKVEPELNDTKQCISIEY